MTVPAFTRRELKFYWHFVGWSCISLGFHVDFSSPNIEIHLPFGFFRYGFIKLYSQEKTYYEWLIEDLDKRLKGVEKYISHQRIDKEIESKP